LRRKKREGFDKLSPNGDLVAQSPVASRSPRRRDQRVVDRPHPLVPVHIVDDEVAVELPIGPGQALALRLARHRVHISGAIALAGKSGGIELATGEMVVEPLTLDNYRNLPLHSDGRPDTDKTSFLVKTRLSANGDAKAALDRISAFIKSVPTVGRAEMKSDGDLTLSIVSPDQYRGRIVELVAADARATAAKLGTDYAVEAKGLDRPVEWSRASLTEVFLYVPYSYTVVPARR
jgi:hypothetical protein